MRKGSRPMKKLLFLGVGTALMITMGGVGAAQADTVSPPHNITMLGNNATAAVSTLGAGACAGCHRVHTATTATLLKMPEALLCNTCHHGQGSSLDVVDGTQNGTAALRGGGFAFAAIGSGAATKTNGIPDPITGRVAHTATVPVNLVGGVLTKQATTSQHLVDGTTSGTMWGNGLGSATVSDFGQTAVVLECGSCHDPHGNGNYRMLRPIPVGTTLPNNADGTKAVGINIPDQPAANKVYTTTDYWNVAAPFVPETRNKDINGVPIALVGAGTTAITDGFLGSISAWCTTCHTRYLSAGAATSSGDKVYTYKHRSDEQASNKPNCIQCHVSHGSNADMSLNPTGTQNPDGTAQNSDLLRVDNRGTCLMCHNM